MERGYLNMQKRLHKSVGIFTFHYAHNFGAALQAFALKTFLQINGLEAQIINYQNKKIRRRYQKNLPFYFFTRHRDWILPWRWNKLLKSKQLRDLTLEDWKRQFDNFKKFQKNFLLEDDNRILNKRDIKKMSYDILIFGSDQIWESGITGKAESVYWGNCGGKKCKKISYGASIYLKKLGWMEKIKAHLFLSDFVYLSVRERKLADALSQILNRYIETVVDPTLLIPKENYLRLIDDCEKRQESYILVYAVSESEELIQCAKTFNMPVKYLHYYKQYDNYINSVEDISDAGPEEFLKLLYQAEYVITNSFHGTVFSIIFEKKFFVVYNENPRIENLLKITNLEKAHMFGINDFDTRKFGEITQNTKIKLEEYVQHSKEYLLNALA